MSLNPTLGGSNSENNWNYSKPTEPGYSTVLEGTMVAIQEVQASKFGAGGQPTGPDFWPDGNPKMNIRMVFAGPNGGYRTWTITPASKAAKEGKKPSVHLDLFRLTGDAAHPEGTDMMNLIGQTLHVETDEPPAGFNYGLGNPRPWRVSLMPGVKYELTEQLDPIFSQAKVYHNQAVSGGQITQPSGTAVTGAAPTPDNPYSDLPF